MNDFLWAAILGMFVATYVVRASFIVFGQKLRFPPAVVQALGHVPVAVLTAIVVPEALRITSYNVCYTKLLRAAAFQRQWRIAAKALRGNVADGIFE